MSLTYVSAELRRLVATRANRMCEYCLIAEEDTYVGCSIDHVVSEKHGGQTELEKLAYACLTCNLAKGSDLGSIDPATGQLVRFYNPRTDRWTDHFELRGASMVPLTNIGDVTCRILGFDRPERREERQLLLAKGRFPHPHAGGQPT